MRPVKPSLKAPRKKGPKKERDWAAWVARFGDGTCGVEVSVESDGEIVIEVEDAVELLSTPDKPEDVVFEVEEVEEDAEQEESGSEK